MDRKGPLVDNRVRIFPTKELEYFLESLEETETTQNIQWYLREKVSKNSNISNDTLNLSVSKNELKLLEHLENTAKTIPETGFDKNIIDDVQKIDTKTKEKYLLTSDIDWLYTYLNNKRKTNKETPYLHELMKGVAVELPENEIIKRNPELEARCVKLRSQQQAREYRKMTKSVDNVRVNFPEDSISYQMKQINRQLIAIGQFIISIFAGFLFGFKGVEWMIGTLDFGFKLLLGVMCALVIALAEIYFLAKKLNEELNIPETTQLGGPAKFADDPRGSNIDNLMKKHLNDKEHQD